MKGIEERTPFHPRPPSQHVSQIVWHREHFNLARISISVPPQAGQAGLVGQSVRGEDLSLFASIVEFTLGVIAVEILPTMNLLVNWLIAEAGQRRACV